MSRTADEFLPVKPVVVHILLALSAGDSHGYGVIQAVRAHSDGMIRLETGPFYRHLNRLLADGLVEDSGARPTDADTRRGAYYRLTPLGKGVLVAEEERLGRLLTLTRSIAGGAGSSA